MTPPPLADLESAFNAACHLIACAPRTTAATSIAGAAVLVLPGCLVAAVVLILAVDYVIYRRNRR